MSVRYVTNLGTNHATSSEQHFQIVTFPAWSEQAAGAIERGNNHPQSCQTPLSSDLEEIGILVPNNQRQHRTFHIQEDVLPCVLF